MFKNKLLNIIILILVLYTSFKVFSFILPYVLLGIVIYLAYCFLIEGKDNDNNDMFGGGLCY